MTHLKDTNSKNFVLKRLQRDRPANRLHELPESFHPHLYSWYEPSPPRFQILRYIAQENDIMEDAVFFNFWSTLIRLDKKRKSYKEIVTIEKCLRRPPCWKFPRILVGKRPLVVLLAFILVSRVVCLRSEVAWAAAGSGKYFPYSNFLDLAGVTLRRVYEKKLLFSFLPFPTYTINKRLAETKEI